MFREWYYSPLVIAVIAAALLMGWMLVHAVFAVWMERKVAGRIQDRTGPTRVGGIFGWLQTLADGIKLLTKEDIVPGLALKLVFRMGPYIVLVGSFAAFMALPFGFKFVAQEMNIALFFILAVLSTEVFGIILIGYGSGSKWSLFGGMREAAQMVSYEIPMAICLIVPVIVAGTLNLSTFVTQQYIIWDWLVFRDPFTFTAFWLYYTCALASCKRAPFDLAEAESELVAGFHTEYSGFRWLVIFMAEYGSMFLVSGIASIVFLGGWNLGLIPGDPAQLLGESAGLGILGYILGNLLNLVVFLFKGVFLVFVMMWVRWTLPRLRIDQVMMTCLKYILPISCALLLAVSLWRLAVPSIVQYGFRFAAFGLTVLAIIMVVSRWLSWSQDPPMQGMPGMWRTAKVLGYHGSRPAAQPQKTDH